MRDRIISKQLAKEVNLLRNKTGPLSGVLFITTYPPRESLISEYSKAIVKALNKNFNESLIINVCALESGKHNFTYPGEVTKILNTSKAREFERLALWINRDKSIRIVVIQYDFDVFRELELSFLLFLQELAKPVSITFHTVVPDPDNNLKTKIRIISDSCKSVVAMSKNSSDLLTKEYGLRQDKISVIANDSIPEQNEHLNNRIIPNPLQWITPTSWESSAHAYTRLFEKLESSLRIKSDPRVINLIHSDDPYRGEPKPSRALTR